MQKFAILLAGCGGKDGSEVQESVTAMYAVTRHDFDYEVFAPDAPQHDVVNHLTDEPLLETRNMLTEAARIARTSKIHDIKSLKSDDFVGLIFPGGLGCAKNLFTFALEGINMQVRPEVRQIIETFHAAGKPIGAMCIAPMMIGAVLRDHNLHITLGPDSPWRKRYQEKMGVQVEITPEGGLCIDPVNKVVTTPCYMYDKTSIRSVGDGAYDMVKAMIQLC